MDVKIDTSGCSLGQDVPNLQFDLEVESRTVEMERVLVMFRKLNSCNMKKKFPTSLQK